jgi:hypothetical protein
MAYPVLTETSLPPATGPWYRRRRRTLGDLPDLVPGAVYVFKTNGRYIEYSDRHLDLADEVVVDANEVSVVQLRTRQILAEVEIPSANPEADFTIRATFRCKVSRAAKVAEAGLADLYVLLSAHLGEDDHLGLLGQDYETDRVAEVRRLVDARIKAYCMIAPPEVAGVDVALSKVEVLTPEDLREQGRILTGERRRQELGRLTTKYEDESLRRLIDIIQSGQWNREALAIVRGERTAAEVADRGHADDVERRRQVAEIIKAAVRQGYNVPMDLVQLVTALASNTAVPEPIQTLKIRTALSGDEWASVTGPPETDDEDDGPDFTSDEDDVEH